VAAAGVISLAAGSGLVGAKADTDMPGRQAYRTNCSLPNLHTGERTCTYTFEYTGTIEPFVVPPSTTPVEITAVGAPGAGKPGLRSRGATVSARFPNLSGVPVLVTVGGPGSVDGYNGGGLGGGGGASDVRLGGAELEHRILVAGGGGGWGEQLIFDEQLGAPRLIPVKGGDAGLPGLGSAGQAGTATEGGRGGGTEYGPGGDGSLGRGGGGGYGTGGGGGGYYGGGGGGACTGTDAENTALCLHSQPGSGGGGSSLVPPGGTFLLTDDLTPQVTISVTQFGYWPMP
jgi:hypothetical protein